MKKSRQKNRPEAASAGTATIDAKAARGKFLWWPWLGGLVALVATFMAYEPALYGSFVFDDRYLPFFSPLYQGMPLMSWLTGARPLLMFSFWLNYIAAGTDPYVYHATNVLLHFFNAVLVALIAARLLEWAGVEEGVAKPTLGIFAGALFLMHPIQTESVAYVASRSEVLSILFYYGAYCVFLYRRTEQITWVRAVAVLVLFGAAVTTKEHTLTLPVLFVLTDLFWRKPGLRANYRLYGFLAVAAVAGGLMVFRVLRSSASAGLGIKGLSPLDYFLTQCRVIWMYVRLVVLPFGQNLDPDIPISRSVLDPLALLGLFGLATLLIAAWTFRKRWPLACFGVFVFLLLLAPTSTIVPILDPMAEHRVYLPFLGIALVALEFLRRMKLSQRLMIEVPVLLLLFVLTYQRSMVWGSTLALWTDTVEKSPAKLRPRSQLAFAYMDQQNCPKAAENYEIASRLAAPDYPLLINWGFSLDCAGRPEQAIAKLRAATLLEMDPQAWTLLGQVYSKQHKPVDAFAAVDQALKLNPNYAMAFAVRGDVYRSIGDFPNAIQQYQRALQLNPYYDPARQALAWALSQQHR